MEILRSREQLASFVADAKGRQQTIGYVPTMGALHRGHLSLAAESKKENDITVVSIFVNPTQFNNAIDLERYPRTTEADIALLQSGSYADALYLPTIQDIYPDGETAKTYEFGGLENEMEGKFRPGHFNGVATVVEKLLLQVQPDIAYFGEKDYQQLIIIKKLAHLLDLPLKIKAVPIMREENGLAMSSRNERLTPELRESAKLIHETLVKANDWFRIITIPEIKQRVSEAFQNAPGFALEYFAIADEDTLAEADFFYPDRSYRAFIAAFAGDVRLIDNMHLD